MKNICLLVKSICLLLILIFPSFNYLLAVEYTVKSNADNKDAPTEGMLRYYIEKSSDGDVIYIPNYYTIFYLEDEIKIENKSLSIIGIPVESMNKKPILSGNKKCRVFNISAYNGTKVHIKNITIQQGNVSGDVAWGGGMYVFENGGEVIVENCLFQSNSIYSSSDGQGGALRAQGGSFINCIFELNVAQCSSGSLAGGAVAANDANFYNCLFFHNMVDNKSSNTNNWSSIINASGNSNIINCTIALNPLYNNSSGAALMVEDNCKVINNIFYRNGHFDENHVMTTKNLINYNNSSFISHCALETSNPLVGTNNIIGLHESPFVDQNEENYSLKENTLCENQGTTADLTLPYYDLAGNIRVWEGAVDMGAYEVFKPSFVVTRSDDNVEYPMPGMLRFALKYAKKGDVITFDVTEIFPKAQIDLRWKSFQLNQPEGKMIRIVGDHTFTLFKTEIGKGNEIKIYNISFEKGNGYAGAIYNTGHASDETIFLIQDCHFIDNRGTKAGGAYISYGQVINCLFENNSSSSSEEFSSVGGLFTGSATLNNCKFINNQATAKNYAVGGLHSLGAKVDNCEFISNYSNAKDGVGGVSAKNGSIFTNCLFSGNYTNTEISSKGVGGAISDAGSFVNCTFEGNRGKMTSPSYNTVGGLLLYTGNVVNCLFIENSGKKAGALLSDGSGSKNVINSTFVKNKASEPGQTNKTSGSIYLNDSEESFQLHNSIIYNNYPVEIAAYSNSVAFKANYSAFENFDVPGDGNIKLTESPFSSINGEDNFLLADNSGLIDKGSIDGYSNLIPSKDLLGNQRVTNGKIDLGAVEYFQRNIPSSIQWPEINSITYGEIANSAILQNGGDANIEGFFVAEYDSIPYAGVYGMEVVFSPSKENVKNYKSVSEIIDVKVDKAQLVVYSKDTSVTYGDNVPVMPIYFSGFVLNDDKNDLNVLPEVDIPDYQNLESGMHTNAIILVGGEDNNYSLEKTQHDLSINKTNLLVSAKDVSMKYGTSARDIFSATYNGFVKGDNKEVLDQLPEIIYNDFNLLDVGVHNNMIVFDGGFDNNYQYEFESGDLTINKAELTVIAKDTTIEIGSSEPLYELEYVGFANNENSSVLDEKPIASVLDFAGKKVGTHEGAIVVSGGEDNNYELKYINGTLVITIPLSINDKDNDAIIAYPNPVKDYIVINHEKKIDDISIVNLDGIAIIKSEKLNTNKINTSKLPSGVYFLLINSGNELFKIKILKD